MSSLRSGTISLRIFLNSRSKITTSDSMLSSSSSSSSRIRGFSSFTDAIGTGSRATRGEESIHGSASDHFTVRKSERGGNFRANGDDNYHPKDDRPSRYESHDNPPNPIPGRPLRGDKRAYNQSDSFSQRKPSLRRDDDERGYRGIPRSSADHSPKNFKNVENVGNESFGENRRMVKPSSGEERDNEFSDQNFLERFKLGAQKREKPFQNNTQDPKTKAEQLRSDPEGLKLEPGAEPEPQSQDADEIFKKMKETGLIPNAVAMLDGLCKDGLVQEAMKLFGLMREKGTFPEVVIYTAVVEGFCKAEKFDDAKRIFRKMQTNGISPNAFSYTILIQGLCKGNRLDDAVEFCVEMVEAGHSPNVATFVGLLNLVCSKKSVEEAQSTIGRLRQKGYFVDEKAIREYLDKKGPFLPLIREVIFGKKSSRQAF